ncbi:hypothetical protein [Klebsiella pneumoniae IS39]|nr:hypothetical protein [Klebsiella pneumoniae IS39]
MVSNVIMADLQKMHFAPKGFFFSDVKLGRSVLGAMAAWASKMDMFDHNVNLVWVMFC